MSGWDDPRMPTIAGLRRRGYTPEAIRDFCERDRRRQSRQPGRRGAARALPARGPQPARAARDGGVAPATPGPRQLPGGPGRRAGGREQSRGPTQRGRAGFRSRASSTSSGRISAKTRRRSISACLRAPRCACATRTSCAAPVWSRIPPRARSSSCTAPTIPSTRGRRRARRPQGEGDHPLGVGAPRPSTLRCACTITSSSSRAPTRRSDWKAALNPNSLERLVGCKLEPSPRRRHARARRYQFERNGYFCVDPVDSSPRAPRLQPHGFAA